MSPATHVTMISSNWKYTAIHIVTYTYKRKVHRDIIKSHAQIGRVKTGP